MYHKHHTKGIVLANISESTESSRVAVFTEQFGLVYARVQAAKNISSKLRGGTQNFSFGDFSLIKGKSGWKAVSVVPEKNYYELLKYSSEKVAVMANVVSLVKKLAPEEDISHHLFSVIKNFLDFLERDKKQMGESVRLAECLVLLRVLHTLGYMRHDPELSIPIAETKIRTEDLELLSPKRARIIALINESLKATQM